jgi:hypothetical protein
MSSNRARTSAGRYVTWPRHFLDWVWAAVGSHPPVDEEIGPAVLIVISHRNPDGAGSLFFFQARLAGHVGEGAVAVVAVEVIDIAIEGDAIAHVNVEPAVPVVVEPGHVKPGAGLVDPGLPGHVLEGAVARLCNSESCSGPAHPLRAM